MSFNKEKIVPHLVDLLFQQFKQEKYFEQFEQSGIEFSSEILVDNLEIILDLIGFPEDNTLEYDLDCLNSDEVRRDETKKIPDDDMFCRDSLIFAYSDMTSDLTDQQIFATKKGLRVEKK